MFSWHSIPFIRILVPFVAGVFLALYFPFGYSSILIGVLVLLFAYAVVCRIKNIGMRYRTEIIIGSLFFFIAIGLGYLRTYWFNDSRVSGYFANTSHAKYFSVTVDDAIVEKTKFYRCYVNVNEVLDSSNSRQKVNGKLLLYLKKGQNIARPQIGDRYLVKAKTNEVAEPSNPEEFNYKHYLALHNIYLQLFADSASCIVQSEKDYSLYRAAEILRDKSLLVLKKYINSPKELGVAEALLMGYKDDLDPDITAAFMRTGTLHVLAVSGMHAGIIYLILAFLTSPLVKRKYGKILQVVLLLAGIWMYAFMTGLSSSVLRASVMFSFIAVGKLLRYNVNIYNNIYSSAFILLLYNPFFILDVGFQLSYLAVLGIVFLQPLIVRWYTPRYRLDKYIWELTSVSLAAQLLTFPIGVFYFHQFPNYFLISNLIIIPLTSLILIGLIALLLLHFIPFAGFLLGKVLLYILQFNNWMVQGIDQLPYSYTNGLYFNILQVLLIYSSVLFFLAYCIHKNKYLIYLFFVTVIFSGIYMIKIRSTQIAQRILLVNHIKGHDVFTCMDGRNAYILADSGFLKNTDGIKFFIEPFLWSRGAVTISKYDLNKTFVATNIFCKKNVGFQFFDKFLTIDKVLKNNVQKNGILLIKKFENNYFENFENAPEYVKFGSNIDFYHYSKIRKAYFKHFKSELKENRSFILISF